MADIDLSGFDGKEGRPAFNVIGNNGEAFTGVFDGNGHTISRLTIVGVSYLGLFGQLDYGAEVRDLGLLDVSITGSGDLVGGLVGFNYRGNVTDCYIDGSVIGNYCVGGLVGMNSGYVTDCQSTGVVTGVWIAGGLVGKNGDQGTESTATVSCCYSAAAVSGNNDVGGLVGDNCFFGYVAQSYSTGSVNGKDYVGGLVGRNVPPYNQHWTTSIVTQCYSTGAVSGNGDNVGGLIGVNTGDLLPPWGGSGIVTQSFWDTETSNQTTGDGGIGKATAEMQTASTFLDAGWDFVDEIENGIDNIWWILEGQDYPRLWWENR